MKNYPLLVLVALVTFLSVFACLSVKARDTALIPAIRTAWPGVRADVEVGIDDAKLQDRSSLDQTVSALDAAIAAGDQVQLSVSGWPALLPYGERGVAARVARGEASSLVAQSLLERLRNFDAAMQKVRIQ